MSKQAPLPKSSDKDFWLDAETDVVTPEVMKAPEHYLEWQGQYAVCTSCPNQHTFPITKHTHRIVSGLPMLFDKK